MFSRMFLLVKYDIGLVQNDNFLWKVSMLQKYLKINFKILPQSYSRSFGFLVIKWMWPILDWVKKIQLFLGFRVENVGQMLSWSVFDLNDRLIVIKNKINRPNEINNSA